ncbi:aldehyde dehydrogenase, partial [Shigella dysenteriae]
MSGYCSSFTFSYFWYLIENQGNDSNLLIVFYVQIMPD